MPQPRLLRAAFWLFGPFFPEWVDAITVLVGRQTDIISGHKCYGLGAQDTRNHVRSVYGPPYFVSWGHHVFSAQGCSILVQAGDMKFYTWVSTPQNCLRYTVLCLGHWSCILSCFFWEPNSSSGANNFFVSGMYRVL